jgi:hypothetical protein
MSHSMCAYRHLGISEVLVSQVPEEYEIITECASSNFS